MSVNKIILVGRLGKDPETRFTSSGQQVTNFSMATDETWKDKASGEKRQKTEWHRITVWGKLAEIVQKYCTKGMLVFIEGSLSTRKWDDKDGITRYSTDITAKELRMLGGGSRPTEDQEDSGSSDTPQSSGQPVGQNHGSEISDEDIPF